MKFFLIVISLALVSCNGQKKVVMDGEVSLDSKKVDSRLELIMQEEQGGFDADETLVIRDAKRLKSFFSKINRTRKPGLPIPDVDFVKEMILIQCIGETSTINPAKLSISKETDDKVILNIASYPQAKEGSSAFNAGSFCIYKMPITSKEVILEKQMK